MSRTHRQYSPATCLFGLLTALLVTTVSAEPSLESYTFTDPVVRIKEVFFTLKGEEFHYQKPNDIESLTVVTHLGYRYPELAKMFESGKAKRFDVSQDKDMFSFLLNAELDQLRESGELDQILDRYR